MERLGERSRALLSHIFFVRPRESLGEVSDMLVWSIALVLVLVCGGVGFYMGAFRTAFTTVGLLLTLLLLKPLSGLIEKLISLFGLSHPVALAIVAPIILFVLVQIIFKSSAVALFKKVDNYYKYKASDLQRMLFERLEQRVGPCLGVLNGTLYVILLGIASLGFGYGTVQLTRGNERDPFGLSIINALAHGYAAAGFTKVVGPYIPVASAYYDVVDLAGEWFHQPLVQSRLAAYPPLITLSEKKEFQSLGNDAQAQEFLLKGPGLGEIYEHAKIQPILQDADLLQKTLGLIGGDFADLKAFVRTGKSEKYDEEKILGRWDFNLPSTVAENKKIRRMSGLEVNKMRGIFNAQLDGATLLATLDNKLILRRTVSGGTLVRKEGSWKSEGGGKYQLKFPLSDDRTLDVTAGVEGRRFQSTILGYQVVFEKW